MKRTRDVFVPSVVGTYWRGPSIKRGGMRTMVYGFVAGAALLLVSLLGAASIASAADVTVNGEIGIRSRYFSELDLNKNDTDADAHQSYNQERVLFEVNVKADTIKGKIAIWNDFDNWGRFEAPLANGTTAGSWSPYLSSPTATNSGILTVREAWVDFQIPGLPLGIKAGHQFVTYGDGWFFRSAYMGSDAWVAYLPLGDHIVSLVDVKAFEGATGSSRDDVDAYTAAGVFKMSDALQGGVNVTVIKDRAGILAAGYTRILTGTAAPAGAADLTLTNVGLTVASAVGAGKVKAEVDIQDGKWRKGALGGTDDMKFSGNQLVAQGSFPISPVTINATLARGSGDKYNPATGTGSKYEGMVDLMDLTQHYTFLYEYKVKTAAGAQYTSFANTTAASIGAMVKVAKSLVLGGDVWYLMATEKANINPAVGGYGTGVPSHDVGTEVDLKANWTLSPNLTWNWVAAYFKPGDVYKQANGTGTDAATGLQGVLIFKF